MLMLTQHWYEHTVLFSLYDANTVCETNTCFDTKEECADNNCVDADAVCTNANTVCIDANTVYSVVVTPRHNVAG